MSRISRLRGAQSEDPRNIRVDIAALCHWCYKQNDEPATLDIATKVLKWTCPDGHVNIIQDWEI